MFEGCAALQALGGAHAGHRGPPRFSPLPPGPFACPPPCCRHLALTPRPTPASRWSAPQTCRCCFESASVVGLVELEAPRGGALALRRAARPCAGPSDPGDPGDLGTSSSFLTRTSLGRGLFSVPRERAVFPQVAVSVPRVVSVEPDLVVVSRSVCAFRASRDQPPTPRSMGSCSGGGCFALAPSGFSPASGGGPGGAQTLLVLAVSPPPPHPGPVLLTRPQLQPRTVGGGCSSREGKPAGTRGCAHLRVGSSWGTVPAGLSPFPVLFLLLTPHLRIGS